MAQDPTTTYPDVGAWQNAAEGQTQDAKTSYPDVGAWQNQVSAGGGSIIPLASYYDLLLRT